MDYNIIESSLANVAKAFISVVFLIVFTFVMGTIITIVQRKSMYVFDDVDTIWINGCIAFLSLIGILIITFFVWLIGFTINGGNIGL